MNYDFNITVDRINTDSVKWDLNPGTIPLWVADMDFHVAKEIKEVLSNRVSHGIYGYSITPKAYYDAEILWWEKRHHTRIEKEWILPTIGVIPALSASVAACTNKGDKVIVMTPVYQYFFSSVTNNGAELIYNELMNDNGYYKINFELLKRQIKEENAKMLILCNPHNPIGRVWNKEELKQLVGICKKENIIIISDEIHRDLTYEKPYIPLLNLEGAKDILITCTAPSKTFNIAGLKTANIVISNQEIREKVNNALKQKEVIEPSIFGMDAAIAAYNYGDEWLDQLLVYLKNNRDYTIDYFTENLPKAIITPLEGTYLMWIDLAPYDLKSKKLEEDLIEAGVFINGGYHYKNDDSHIRVNIATSQNNLKKAYKIIRNFVLKNET